MRASTHTFVVFVDIEKAFDTAWVEATLVRLHDAGVQGLLWRLISNFLRHTVSQVRLGGDLSEPWPDSGIAQGRVLSPLLFNLLVDGLAVAVHHASPGVLLPGSVDRFTAQLYADDLVIAAESPSDLQTALNAVSEWGFRFRFRFGVGPTKSAVMVFGPRRRVPDCHVQLNGVSLPVVLSYKYLGVVVTPALSWSKHVQHLVSRGNRLFAQCVPWCRAEHLPVHMASSIFSVYVLSSVSWSFEFCTQSPSALRFMDKALRRWGRHLLGWPAGSPCAGVLCELGWPDAEHLVLGRLLSLLGRTSSMAQGPPSPLPASILRVASESPGTWAHHALSMCSHLGIPSPSAAGIHPQWPPHHVHRWVDSIDSPSLCLELRHRLQASICNLSTSRLPDGVVPPVACGPDRLVYGRGSSPEHVRLLGLARWGHDCLPCGRPARHVGLPERCRFCDAAVGDLWHCLSECPSLADLRAQWAFRCGIPPQAVERWSHHSWMYDPGLAIDTTLVSPLSRDGSATRRAANHDGAALQRARRKKEVTYPELSGEGGRARLVVLAAEVGGRWSIETAQFLSALSSAKAQSAPHLLRGRVEAA